MEFVLAGLLGLVSFEKYDSAAFVAGRKVVSGLVELDGGYYVCLSNIFYVTLVTEAPGREISQQIVIGRRSLSDHFALLELAVAILREVPFSPELPSSITFGFVMHCVGIIRPKSRVVWRIRE